MAAVTLEELARIVRDLGAAVQPAVTVAAQAAQAARDVAQIPAPAPAPPRIKGPTFNGKGDVEVFLRSFADVADHQGWDDRTSVLKLRESLTEETIAYGEYNNRADIEAALRRRYGQTAEESRTALRGLKREATTSLAEHAEEVQRLIRRGYPGTPANEQQALIREHFRTSANHAGLQNFLLLVQGQGLTVPEMVSMGTEYLQQNEGLKGTHARMLATLEEEPGETVQIATTRGSREELQELIDALRTLIQDGHRRRALRRDGGGGSLAGRKGPRIIICWGCREEGHIRRNCPRNQPLKKEGNEEPPRE